MRLRSVCGCGLTNHNVQDWTCHFKYRGFFRGLSLLLKTRIRLEKSNA